MIQIRIVSLAILPTGIITSQRYYRNALVTHTLVRGKTFFLLAELKYLFLKICLKQVYRLTNGLKASFIIELGT